MPGTAGTSSPGRRPAAPLTAKLSLSAVRGGPGGARRRTVVAEDGGSAAAGRPRAPKELTTGERPIDRFERDERAVLLPLATCPYRRLGVRHAPEPAPRRLPATVKIERRPLSVYAEALQ